MVLRYTYSDYIFSAQSVFTDVLTTPGALLGYVNRAYLQAYWRLIRVHYINKLALPGTALSLTKRYMILLGHIARLGSGLRVSRTSRTRRKSDITNASLSRVLNQMKAIAGLDLGAVPLGRRFDMLLKHLDEDDGNSGSEADFSTAAVLSGISKSATGIRDASPLVHQPSMLSDPMSDELSDDPPSCAEPDDEITVNPAVNTAAETEFATQSVLFGDDTGMRHSSGSENGSSDSDFDEMENRRALAKIYSNAGIEQPKNDSKKRPQSSKSTGRETEYAARQELELERSVRDEVGIHTVKSKTVDSFLESLGDSDREEKEPQLHAELASSPPRVPGLVSFVGAPIDLSDDELEIVPETKSNKMSRAVKAMLEFSGGSGVSTADLRLTNARERLHELGLKQAAARRAERLRELEESNVDVDRLRAELQQTRSRTRLDAERANAASVQLRERGSTVDSNDENDVGDAQLRDLSESSEPSDSETDSGELRRRRLMSDGASDSDSADVEPNQATLTSTVPASAEQAPDADWAPTVVDDNVGTRSGTTIRESVQSNTFNQTQYVAPADDIAELLGISEMESSATEGQDEEEEEPLILNDRAQDDQNPTVDVSSLPLELPPSQQLSELRRRYEHAQAEQRRAEDARLRARAFVESEAEESDDGAPAQSDDEASDEGEGEGDLADLVDNAAAKGEHWDVRQKFVQDELRREEQALRVVARGVNGQSRGGRFLDEDDTEAHDASIDSFIAGKRLALGAGTTEKSSAFFASVTESLVVRQRLPARGSSVEEGLQFLQMLAESHQRGLDADLRSDDLPEIEHVPLQRPESRPLLRTIPRQPALRTNTIADSRSSSGKSTYASRLCAAEASTKTVEILHTLRRTTLKRPDQTPITNHRPKRSNTSPQASRLGNNSLFKRNWN